MICVIEYSVVRSMHRKKLKVMSHKAVTYVPVDLFHCLMEKVDVHCENISSWEDCILLYFSSFCLNNILTEQQLSQVQADTDAV